MRAWGVFDGEKLVIAFSDKKRAKIFKDNGSPGLKIREIEIL